MEVNSQVLVQLVASSVLAKWHLCNVIRRIPSLLMFFTASLVHVFHEVNSSADKLASLYLHWDKIFDNALCLSSTIRSVVSLDARNVPFVRTMVDKN